MEGTTEDTMGVTMEVSIAMESERQWASPERSNLPARVLSSLIN